ncbi:MAG: hypothetical protein EXX96DRAFT_618560 [Benjaminiella poitrasii]|nr:MAG: hypothetical protein EXX96DRAFT_618560 [Benjaminiella poitrasii]
MVSLSNYINEYSFLLYRLITYLRTSTFTRLPDGSVDLQQRTGINFERILPEGFQNTTAIRAFLPPIVRQCLEAEGADQQFSKLFDDSELRILHALYFGSRGSKAIASHPFLSALTSDIRKENDWQEMAEPFLMRLALAQYMINFKNIWSNKKLFGTMLTRAITRNIPIPRNEITVIGKSHNARRRLIRDEEKRRQTYLRKAQERPEDEAKFRAKADIHVLINEKAQAQTTVATTEPTLLQLQADLAAASDVNPIAEQQLQAMEDEQENERVSTGDIPRRRIKQLMAMIRKVLYKRTTNPITEQELLQLIPNLQTNELECCLRICRFFKPYIPERKLVPRPSVGSVNALKLDPPSIFNLFCTSNKRQNMDLYDYDDNRIISRNTATELKDAVFGSFFDLDQLQQLCATFGSRFAHNMYLLPAAKTVRITAEVIPALPTVATTVEEVTIVTKVEVTEPEEPKESEATTPAADVQQKEQIQTLETELANLMTNLANAYVERNKILYALANLKRTHQQRQADEDEINNQIRMTKSNKRHILEKIAEIKQQVANIRQQLYIISQKTPRENELTVQSEKQIIGFESRELGKVEEFQLTPVALERFRFSGTDNGLVVMTDTVKLSLERFRFHLRLYVASIDGETYNLRENEERFLYPEERSFKVFNKSLQHESGGRKWSEKHVNGDP